MAHLIEVKDAYKIYNPGENEVHALDGVSLTVDRGEFLMIVGHSGSGKSTLMNMLGLLDICTSGEYLIDGKDVSNLSDDELSEIRNKEIGFIFQGFNLIPSLTAKGNVELPLIYRGVKKEEREKLSVVFLQTLRPVDHQNGHIRFVKHPLRAQHALLSELLLVVVIARGVDDHDGAERQKLHGLLHGIGRRTRPPGHDRQILPGNGVYNARFSRVSQTEKADVQAVGRWGIVKAHEHFLLTSESNQR